MHDTPNLSLRIRAVVALSLGAGFYLLATGMAAAFIWLIYYQYFVRGHLDLWFTAICVIGLWMVVSAMIPRAKPFIPPGPRLTAENHPKLFAVIEEVASATGQAIPQEVYLVHNMEAWVTERSSFMGRNRVRMMALGLPLLSALTTSQLRAVVAHEFGHYAANDTSLGPTIYRLREAIGRTIDGFGDTGWFFLMPFLWYGKLFMRITQAISRAQEYGADRVAVRVAGAEAMRGALEELERKTPAFQAYWSHEVLPVLQAGLHPPILEGFERFISQERTSEALSDLEQRIKSAKPSPYDSHPILKQRSGAIAAIASPEIAQNHTPAINLLSNLEHIEAELLGTPALEPVEWDGMAARVHIPLWIERLTDHHKTLRDLTPSKIASDGLRAVGQTLLKEIDHTGDSVGYARYVLSLALALALHKNGWEVQTLPGSEITCSKDGTTLEPFTALGYLSEEPLQIEAWSNLMEHTGVANLSLHPNPAEANSVMQPA